VTFTQHQYKTLVSKVLKELGTHGVYLDQKAGIATMTAQILAVELGNLIQDSKRKNTELRTAAEKSLQDLRSLPNTSEVQLAAGKHMRFQSPNVY
jgi:hypothetical protein